MNKLSTMLAGEQLPAPAEGDPAPEVVVPGPVGEAVGAPVAEAVGDGEADGVTEGVAGEGLTGAPYA